jgi:hypothetical protein
LQDEKGDITIQVKLQRSAKKEPVVVSGKRYSLPGQIFTTETQRTRNGKDAKGLPTRFYASGEFDLLAVSLQPAGKGWEAYMYTVGNWLIRDPDDSDRIAVMQPVTQEDSEYWTSDLNTAIGWFREEKDARRMVDTSTRTAQEKAEIKENSAKKKEATAANKQLRSDAKAQKEAQKGSEKNPQSGLIQKSAI